MAKSIVMQIVFIYQDIEKQQVNEFDRFCQHLNACFFQYDTYSF
jgi:hypothetical protein